MKLEEEIIRDARKDIKCFDALYSEYYPLIDRFVFHRVSDTQTRHEIVSDVFYTAMNKLSMFRWFGKGSFQAWLIRIAMNEVNGYYRRSKRNTRIREKLQWESDVHMGDMEDENDNFDYGVIRSAMQQLPLKDQNLLSLRFFNKMKHKEIAEVFKTTEGAIKVRQHRALTRLREIVEGDNNGF